MSLGEIIRTCKSNAWNTMKKVYWWAVLLCFLAALLGAGTFKSSGGGGSIGSGSSGSTSSYSQSASKQDWNKVLEEIKSKTDSGNPLSGSDIDELVEEISKDDDAMAGLIVAMYIVIIYLIVFIPIILIVAAIAAIFRLLVSYPVTVGKYHYFLHVEDDENSKKSMLDLFHVFKTTRYGYTVLKMFLVELYVALWTMLFIIPGIIKKYSYFMVPYLTAENPKIDSKRAFEISKQAMSGNKWNLFVLQLSFLGWELLAVLTCGLGFIFLSPYYEAAMSEFYKLVKSQALEKGIASQDEFVM